MEDVLREDYYQHIALQLRPRDLIEVEPEDGTWSAVLRVLAAGRQWANVTLLSQHEYGPIDQKSVSADYIVEHKGPLAKWRLRRLSDSVVIKDGMDTQAQAEQFKLDHISTVARK